MAAAGPGFQARGEESQERRSRLAGVGVQLPQQRLATSDLLALCRNPRRLDLERLTGIRERRVCGPEEDSLSLAVGAALDCLDRSGLESSDIELLINGSITRYHGERSAVFEPAQSQFVKEAIGATEALDFDVTNACAGMLTGVTILDDFIRRGVVRRGMVVSGERISSLAFNATKEVRSILSKQLASLTLGDAGAAVILEEAEPGNPGISLCHLTTLAQHSHLCVGRACPTAPGGKMRTEARKIHKVAIETAGPILADMLSRCALSIEDIDWVIPHQTSERAIWSGLKSLKQQIGGGPRNVVANLEEFGNTASTTHFLALHRWLEEGRIRTGDKVLLVCSASGLVAGAILLTMDSLADRYARPD